MNKSKKGIETVKKFEMLIGNNEIITQLIGNLPYMIGIFDLNGILVYGNKKFFENYNIAKPNETIGYYNLLKDKFLLDVRGLRNFVERVFKGEILIFNNYKTPLEKTRHTKQKEIVDEIRLHDLVGYPIYEEEKIAYLVFTSQIIRVYSGRKEIMKAQEYIKNNWIEEFNLETIANTSGLSISQFSRLFKKCTEKTPYEYYKNLKIKRLKERLLDPNLTITDAFSECGIDYNGRYRKFFKEIVGMTPYEYRKTNSIYKVKQLNDKIVS